MSGYCKIYPCSLNICEALLWKQLLPGRSNR